MLLGKVADPTFSLVAGYLFALAAGANAAKIALGNRQARRAAPDAGHAPADPASSAETQTC